MMRLPLLVAVALIGAGCERGDGIDGAGERGGPTVRNAWVRAVPPGSMMLAAYGELNNPGGNDITVTAIRSELGGGIELHRTVEVEGVARMRQVDPVMVAAGDTLVMEPGGYHLMIHGPDRVPAEGESVWLQLEFADGGLLEFTAEVRRSAP